MKKLVGLLVGAMMMMATSAMALTYTLTQTDLLNLHVLTVFYETYGGFDRGTDGVRLVRHLPRR